MTTRGRVLQYHNITRPMVCAERERLFVFGDNIERRGYGGQAASMRGEPNAVGIPTKWAPTMLPKAFFSDADWNNSIVRGMIELAFIRLELHIAAGGDVVFPSAGIGSGLADLARRAPLIFDHIQQRILKLTEGGHDPA